MDLLDLSNRIVLYVVVIKIAASIKPRLGVTGQLVVQEKAVALRQSINL